MQNDEQSHKVTADIAADVAPTEAEVRTADLEAQEDELREAQLRQDGEPPKPGIDERQ